MNDFLLAGLSALGLGILTAVHPCLMVLNISAFTLISGYSDSLRRVFVRCSFYMVGRTFGYVAIGFFIKLGIVSIPSIAIFLQNTIFRFIGPVLIIIGMLISGLLPFHRKSRKTSTTGFTALKKGYFRLGLAGFLHTLTFCPASAGLYFGVLVPLAFNYHSEILISGIYGFGAGLPVVVTSALSALGVNFLLAVKNRFVEFWLPKFSGTILIVAGIYFTVLRVFIIRS